MKRALLTMALAGAAVAGWGVTHLLGAPSAAPRTIEVWKSQTCGCCTAWIAYVEDNGYAVQVHDVDDVDPVKDDFAVPAELRSCHTARIAGYVLEGHVPVAAIARLVAERPKDIDGIAVPDMPPGAPGMDEDDSPYPVVAFGTGGIRLLEH